MTTVGTKRVALVGIASTIPWLLASTALAQTSAESTSAAGSTSPQIARALAGVAPTTQIPESGAPSGEGEIVVTGSRLRNGFTTPTPVTALSTDQLLQLAPNSAGEALAQLPAFIGSQVTSKGGSASSILSGAQALLNLRGLGSNRTLVLLNGERLPPTNVLGSVDTNVIPQSLISRVDVVTGGASSTYGSDAIAGVVNFILNNKFTGVEIRSEGGVTTYGDGTNEHITVTAGRAFNDGRLRIEGSFEYFHQDGIDLPPTGRSWFDQAAGVISLPTGSATQLGVVSDVRFSTTAYGGLITKLNPVAGRAVGTAGTAALLNMQFGANGALFPFDHGTITGAAFQSGGSGPSPVNGFSPSQRRIGGFSHAEYDVSDHLTVFGELQYKQSHTYSVGADAYQQTTRAFTIYADNPYLPAPVASLLAANNIASFTLGRYTSEIPIINVANNSLSRANVGLRGDLSSRWSFDASAAYGRSVQDFAEQLTINRNLYAAADAVLAPSGNIVCRSTLSGLDVGCVPINVLGTNTISQAGKNYVSGFDDARTTDSQFSFNANLRGDLGEKINLGAGPISVALGAAYRLDDVRRVVSPLSSIITSCAGLRATGCAAYNVYGGYQTYNPSALSGSIGVTEGFAEVGIPILRDLPLIRAIDLDLAGRVTNYSTSGVTYTWKVGPSWKVTDEFRLRLTRSQDIRAPSANDLFSQVSSSQTTTSVLYPNSTSGTNGTSIQLVTGNPNLKPEVAQTLTVGGVYQPSWLHGFEASVDYYKIDIDKAISSPVSQNVVDQCFAGNQVFCQLITIGGAPVTTTAGITAATPGVVITLAPINIASVKTSGLDVELGYSTRVGGGKLTARALGNYTFTYSNSALIAPSGPILIGALGINQLAVTSGGGLPRWTMTLTQQYEHSVSATSTISLGLVERLIADGQINPNYTTAQLSTANNHVPQVTYVDANLNYDFEVGGTRLGVYLNVINLFNKNPPIDPIATTFQAPTNFQIYDVLGRRFTAGLKVKF